MRKVRTVSVRWIEVVGFAAKTLERMDHDQATEACYRVLCFGLLCHFPNERPFSAQFPIHPLARLGSTVTFPVSIRPFQGEATRFSSALRSLPHGCGNAFAAGKRTLLCRNHNETIPSRLRQFDRDISL